jgi:hypothetical protein
MFRMKSMSASRGTGASPRTTRCRALLCSTSLIGLLGALPAGAQTMIGPGPYQSVLVNGTNLTLDNVLIPSPFGAPYTIQSGTTLAGGNVASGWRGVHAAGNATVNIDAAKITLNGTLTQTGVSAFGANNTVTLKDTVIDVTGGGNSSYGVFAGMTVDGTKLSLYDTKITVKNSGAASANAGIAGSGVAATNITGGGHLEMLIGGTSGTTITTTATGGSAA